LNRLLGGGKTSQNEKKKKKKKQQKKLKKITSLHGQFGCISFTLSFLLTNFSKCTEQMGISKKVLNSNKRVVEKEEKQKTIGQRQEDVLLKLMDSKRIDELCNDNMENDANDRYDSIAKWPN
jgi:hypothetical protein